MSYINEINATKSKHEANALVFAWLSDDEHRSNLFAELRERRQVLSVLSRAKKPVSPTQVIDQDVHILTRTSDIKTALSDYSNAPYKGIGGGTFVLALDNGEGHEGKRKLLGGAFDQLRKSGQVSAIAFQAAFHAMVGPCKSMRIDAGDIAEQAALRFVSAFVGIPDKDHGLLQETMRAVYQGMITQMYARHFATEPTLVDQGKAAMGRLVQRVGELIADTDSVKLTAEVFTVLQLDSARAFRMMSAVAKAVREEDEGIKEHVTAFESEIAKEVVSARATATFLDAILNAFKVRSRLAEIVAVACNDSPAFRDSLITLIERIVKKKLDPEDRLIPRRYMLQGTTPIPLVPAPGESDDQFKARLESINLNFRPTLIEAMARDPGAISGTEVAVAVVGTIAGLMGNVIAGVCIALNQFFDPKTEGRAAIRAAAGGPLTLSVSGVAEARKRSEDLYPFVKESLRLNPPAAFVPRMTKIDVTIPLAGGGQEIIKANSEVLVPLGAATRDPSVSSEPDKFSLDRPPSAYDFIFGHPDKENLKSHRCVGEHVALALIAQIVRSMLALKDLAQVIENDKPIRLRKKWGYICESLPLTHAVAESLVHRPLNVVMKIKTPVGEHAEALKKIIKYAAPSIEQLLIGSGIVHSARFVFLNSETELGLFTVYDGEFKPYIEHFGRVAGRLFDRLFEHIEQPPPMPVRDHIPEFVEHLRQFDLPSAENYFFSAYPGKTVKAIV